MKVVACYKWVADEADLRVDSDGAVDLSHAACKISDFDRSAIEAAVSVANDLGDTAVTLSYGTENVAKSLKDALSRGPEEGFWIADELAPEADGRATALALAAGVQEIGDVSVVVCAEGASDTYAREIAPRLGAVLDWPVVTSVVAIEVEGGKLICTRKLADVMQKVAVEAPCVISVMPEGFEPTVPGLKALMQAGRKPSTRLEASDLGIDSAPMIEKEPLQGFVMSRKNLLIAEEDMAVAVRELVSALRKEGVL